MQPLVQRIRGLWGVTALLALLMLLVSGAAWAQNAQGTIVGHVTDPSGAIVPGATVTVLDLSTGLAHTLTTNAAGDYTVPALNPGQYKVTIQASGFTKQTSSELTLEVQQTLRQDFRLAVGSATQTVTVNATTQMLHTDDTTIGQ